MARPAGWQELAPGVMVVALEHFRLNVGLVCGSEMAVLIDTGPSLESGRELVELARRVTPLPLGALNTHDHFDHCFGNGAFDPSRIWGHRLCAEHLRWDGEERRREVVSQLRHDDMELARQVASSPLVAPGCILEDEIVLELGERRLTLTHPGRGHSDNDVIARVADAGVMFAGDLVEEGAPPSFEDSFPMEWPDALRELVSFDPAQVVPGHGGLVDAEFVRRQCADLVGLADLCRNGFAVDRGAWDLLDESPFPRDATRVAVRRAYQQLGEAREGGWLDEGDPTR